MKNIKTGRNVSTKLNLIYLLSLLVVTSVQAWLRYNTDTGLSFVLSIILTIISFLVIGFFTYRVVTRSLHQLLEVASQWRNGDLSAKVSLNTGDEFQQLGDTYNALANELNQTLKSLEKTIAERTLILQRRAKQLQAAAEIGRAAVTIRDLDILLTEATRHISTRFEVYHVGIFLLDPASEFAVLRAANSEGGKQLMAENHQLRVGIQGIVGYVASSGEPRISLDVGTDAIHYKNPHLPETRSEIALPLSVGGKMLGVLDVQSSRAAAFTEDDTSILQIMADQIAIAIDNARLFAESQTALEKTKRAYGELSRDIWTKLLHARADIGYVASKDIDEVIPSQRAWYPEVSVANQSGQIVHADGSTVAIPLILRDKTIGFVRLQKSENKDEWSDDEIRLMETITNQISIALESARLFEDTQRRAERERLAGEITAKMRASNKPEEILSVTVQQLREALQVDRAQVLVKVNNPQPDPAVISSNGHPEDNLSS
jgi:GAF domain-containing protein/HAMP domain-containing protein